MIVFVGCGTAKQDGPCRARDLYIGTWFTMALRYAESLRPRRIYVLSARYGLLELDDIVARYDATLYRMTKDQRKQWAEKVRRQFEAKGESYDEPAVFICGKKYREYLEPRFGRAVCPVQGLGIRKQYRFFKENTR